MIMSGVHPSLLRALQVTAAASAVVTYAIPITAFLPSLRSYYARRQRGGQEVPIQSVEMPPLSVTAQLLATALWGSYSVLLNDLSFSLPCVFGFLCGLLFLFLYTKFHKPEVYGHELQIQTRFVAGVFAFFLLWFLVSLLIGVADEQPLVDLNVPRSRDLFGAIGWVAAVASVLLRCHPVFVLLRVLKTHNVSKMGTLWMQCIMLLNSCTWFVYAGIILGSKQVRTSSGSSTIVNSVALFIRFRERFLLDDHDKVLIPDAEYVAALADGSRLSNTILFCDRLVSNLQDALKAVFLTIPSEGGSFLYAKLAVLDKKRRGLWHVDGAGGVRRGTGGAGEGEGKDGGGSVGDLASTVLGSQHCGI